MTNTPQITISEVLEWENKFKESVTPQVQFLKNQGEDSSMKLYNGDSGIDAQWAGTILLGSDSIKWSFSIQNEPFIEAKMKLIEQNYTILTNLYNFYNDWKEEWSKQLTIPDENRDDTQMQANGDPNIAATPQPTAGNMPNDLGGPNSLQERRNNRTINKIVENHSARMKRLAGI